MSRNPGKFATPIPRAAAKDELARINGELSEPCVLIGGLAVQQYCTARISQDIDLLCDFKTAQALLSRLYPTKDWEIADHSNDDYRPSYHVRHRYLEQGEIILGFKVSEREPYAHLDWTELGKGAVPFRHKTQAFKKVLVPLPHALAYSKFLAFAMRQEDETTKLSQDLGDFCDLTNHADFKLSAFWDLLNRSDPHGTVRESFRARLGAFPGIVTRSCLHSLCSLFEGSPSVERGSSHERLNVYVAGPHGNIQKNGRVAQALRAHGLVARVPYEQVEAANITTSTVTNADIRRICIEAIESCQALAVDLDAYGLDTAWELGYAEGLGKRIVGYNLETELTSTERYINRKIYSDNFMHGWTEDNVFRDLDKAAAFCADKVVYVCGSFSNAAIVKLSRSRLGRDAKRLIIPKDHVHKVKSKLPRDYPIADRSGTNKLLASADVVLVALPRYGMDSSWQIGYATALKKPLIGLLRADDKRTSLKQTFWDHWMHGWQQKTHVVSVQELVAFLRGLESAGLVPV